MYSPRIRDDLIPRIYRAAKAAGIAMTVWVNQVIEQALSGGEEKADQTNVSERKEMNHD